MGTGPLFYGRCFEGRNVRCAASTAMSRARAAYFHLVLLLFGPAPAIAINPGGPGKEKEGQAAAVTTAKLANIATRRTKMPAKIFQIRPPFGIEGRTVPTEA